jgi:hypothetical protein
MENKKFIIQYSYTNEKKQKQRLRNTLSMLLERIQRHRSKKWHLLLCHYRL